ncbi:alpha-mannosidase [Paenibacillus sp. 598K]|uniref:alpha-mannosidase n=1 Tax=Paenibacillus sp. 598K TaxID=1117987 RepID=UPI000FFA6CD3|nr:alpha-mannosidase [Paenibacillus sp. 598K]GBF72506.1 alpha-mannosidase [Paenibacillus sp. 598K]
MTSTLERRLRDLLGPEPKSYWEEKITEKYGYWGGRMLAQLSFAYEMSKVNEGKYDGAIEKALTNVEAQLAAEGVISKSIVLETEAQLQELAEQAKSYEVLCVAHAHIDMNWMWSWDETVAVTLDTFRTMLNLMDEYPTFTFSQSQASIYRIVEQFAPAMLAEIKQRVKEGRWEVTASHWVEADKNMPSGESLSRHMLYAKRYLAELFELDIDSLNIDFEPDTFGHSLNVPEILANGGVKFFYHCRGNEAPIFYHWEAPSGQSVLVYREPTWYNDNIQSSLGTYVPDICRQTGLNTYLKVYGVGDHGGGPTRRDLERLIDMNDWPIYPRLRFGTYREFFALAEKVADRFPVVRGEQNFVFTGCYTSQSRIKTANRMGEAALNEAEAFNAVASVEANAVYPGEAYEEAWRNVLFNQFHDILPGSGVIETREHALGLFQQTMAIANTNRKLAMEQLAAGIDTSALTGDGDRLTVSEGAGAGYGSRTFQITQVERGRGNTRIVHLFNPSVHAREEVVEIVLWDWKSPIKELAVRDSAGQPAPYQVIDQGYNVYWGHDYIRILAFAKAPACGYATYTISEGDATVGPYQATEPRIDLEDTYVLENERLQVVFDTRNGTVRSLLNKETGEQLIDPAKPAGMFRLIQEDPERAMTSWRVGRYMEVESLHDRAVKIKKGVWGPLRQTVHLEFRFGQSLLRAYISLDHGSPFLRYDLECDWHEIGRPGDSVPQLNFYWPLAAAIKSYQYDVPYGIIEREPLAHDVPGNSFMLAVPTDESAASSVMLVTNNKYGFRGTDDSLAVALIRSSYDPDLHPELGNHHRASFAIGVLPAGQRACERIETAYRFNHPLSVLSGTAHAGGRSLDASFLELVGGTAAVSGLKMPEEAEGGKVWIIRLYETEGAPTTVRLRVAAAVTEAWFVDTLERRLPDGGAVRLEETGIIAFELPAYAAAAVRLQFG